MQTKATVCWLRHNIWVLVFSRAANAAQQQQQPLTVVFHVSRSATRELHKTCNGPLMLQTWGCWSWEIYCMEQFCSDCHIKQETEVVVVLVVVGVKTSVCSGKMSKHTATCPLTVRKCRNELVGYHSSVQFGKMISFHCSTQIHLHPPPLCRNVLTKQSQSRALRLCTISFLHDTTA